MLLKKEKFYKITIAIIFGSLGFFFNFHTIIFPFGEYTIAVLFGLLFPLLIALSWGWRYGLLSALAGGCQSMWWLWGPSNGYAVFFIVLPFTLWIVWHGLFAEIRRGQTTHKWWLNMYVVEIPFRILNSINLLTLSRWAISFNPPTWNWAAGSTNIIPLQISFFVVIKQAAIGFVLLLLADVLLNISYVRVFFKLKKSVDERKTGYIISTFLLMGCLFWILDSFFYSFAFHKESSFIDLFALNIPGQNIFTRIFFFIFCMVSGLVTSKILRRQKEGELALRKSEDEAKTSEAFLRTLIQSIPDLVWLKNRDGVFLSCNHRVENLFGAKEKDIVGKTDYDFIDRGIADSFRQQDNLAMAKRKPCTNEEEVVFADDDHHEILETIKTPMFDKDGQLIGVLSIGRNITERANLQAQLVQAQKMESVGRLAGGVAHDYNNISSIILGYSELALDMVDQNDPVRDNLLEILNAVKRSADITRQLLAFARKQTIAPKILNLNDTIEGTLKMLRRLIGEDIDLSWMPGAGDLLVRIDPSQGDQILANLCVNARDAISNVGKVVIETKSISLDEDYCTYHPESTPGDYIMLVVSDNGSGIEPDLIDKIFEPFFTTKGMGKGTGLGLATVYGIVKQNNGFINIYSEQGEGTTFRIYLPRYTGVAVEEHSQYAVKAPLSQGETILLVEDDSSILKLGKRMLEDLGYSVLSSTSPNEATKLAEKHISEINLLITDVVMPEMNGRELTEQLLNIYPNLKVLFMSGYTADVIAHRGVLEDGVCFVSKPFSKKEMAIKVREALDFV